MPAALAQVARRRVLDVDIAVLTHGEALSLLVREAGLSGGFARVGFANAHTLNLAATDPGYRSTLARFLVLPDGVGVDLASRILHGALFPANLNGTDFTPALLAALPPGRIGLLGARPGVAERAAARLCRDMSHHAYVVLGDGYFDADAEARLLHRLEQQPVDVLLVAFGNPRQEQWIAERLDHRHARVALGVGALFDFLAGEVSRAPALVRRLRAEWIWRLAREPGRLWRRYVLGNPLFLARVLAERIGRR
jgi:exopolysaccharide biosynthesis WecB/TagA/CpsF family protein